MQDVEKIAEGLTPDEREALNSLPRIGGNNPFRNYTVLLDLGLADCTITGDDDAERWRITLTEKGRVIKEKINASK